MIDVLNDSCPSLWAASALPAAALPCHGAPTPCPRTVILVAKLAVPGGLTRRRQLGVGQPRPRGGRGNVGRLPPPGPLRSATLPAPAARSHLVHKAEVLLRRPGRSLGFRAWAWPHPARAPRHAGCGGGMTGVGRKLRSAWAQRNTLGRRCLLQKKACSLHAISAGPDAAHMVQCWRNDSIIGNDINGNRHNNITIMIATTIMTTTMTIVIANHNNNSSGDNSNNNTIVEYDIKTMRRACCITEARRRGCNAGVREQEWGLCVPWETAGAGCCHC